MEIRILYLEDVAGAPVSGYAMYVIVEETARKVHLLHPITFDEFWVTAEVFRAGACNQLWPENRTGDKFEIDRFLNNLKIRMQEFALRNKVFPTTTLMKVMAGITGNTLQEVESMVKAALPAASLTRPQQDKIGREYRVVPGTDFSKFRGRERAVLEALWRIKQGSIHIIVDACKDTLKTKVNRERAVTYFINSFVKRGVVEVIGEQFPMLTLTGENANGG